MPINRLNALCIVALVLFLTGCGTNGHGAKLPYDSWRLGLFAPNYMEVWIETADVVDVNNRWFRRAMSGLAAISTPPNLKGNPKGWPKTLELAPESRSPAPPCLDLSMCAGNLWQNPRLTMPT